MSDSSGPTRTPGPAGPRISIVVPLFNERENLVSLHAEIVPVLEALGEPFEILFVDDGSTDGSDAILRDLRASDRRARVLRFSRNAGQTAAMSAGFEAARGEIVVTIDADLQNDPRDIPVLLGEMDGYDAVVGWRGERRDSWLRRISSRVGNRIRNLVSGDDIIDTGCTLKAFRRDALARVKLFHGMHRFLPTLLRIEGCRVRQVKVGHRPRAAGESKYNLRNRAARSLADLLAVRWMKRRAIRYHVTEED